MRLKLVFSGAVLTLIGLVYGCSGGSGPSTYYTEQGWEHTGVGSLYRWHDAEYDNTCYFNTAGENSFMCVADGTP